MGENPAVGSANGGAAAQGPARSSTGWSCATSSRSRRPSSGTTRPRSSAARCAPRNQTEVFFFPAAAHTEKDGSFTNTQRLLQWHDKAVEPPGDAAPSCGSCTTSGRRLRSSTPARRDPTRPAAARPRPGTTRRRAATTSPSAEAVLARDQRLPWPTGEPVDGLHRARGRRLDGLRLLDLPRLLRGRRQPDRAPQAAARAGLGRARVGLGLAGQPAHPLQPRLGRPRRAARGRSARRYVWWDDEQGRWTGYDAPDFIVDRPPDYRPARGRARDRRHRRRRPVHHDGGRQGLALRAQRARRTARCRRTTSRSSRRRRTRSTAQQSNPAPHACSGRTTRYHRAAGTRAIPYVITTYRLTEHHTAGGIAAGCRGWPSCSRRCSARSRPELAAELGIANGGWVTIAHRARPRSRRGPS